MVVKHAKSDDFTQMKVQVIGRSSDPCDQREEGTTVGADESLWRQSSSEMIDHITCREEVVMDNC
jgi:hypothetical protein